MRHILAGLFLAGALTLSTLAAFAGDNSTKDVPSLPIDQAFAQLQVEAAGAAGSPEVAPSIMEQRGNNFDTRE